MNEIEKELLHIHKLIYQEQHELIEKYYSVFFKNFEIIQKRLSYYQDVLNESVDFGRERYTFIIFEKKFNSFTKKVKEYLVSLEKAIKRELKESEDTFSRLDKEVQKEKKKNLTNRLNNYEEYNLKIKNLFL